MRNPLVRLAYGGPAKSVESGLTVPTVRLAHSLGAQGDNVLVGRNGVEQLPNEVRPAILVSYAYLKTFAEQKERLAYRDWALDSGAFTAYQLGKPVVLEEYIEDAKALVEEDDTLSEVFALDVIGDWKASAANVDRMWEAGIRAIPCFHAGSPEHELIRLSKTFPKIALGGIALAKTKKKLAWARQCFARVWPCAIHGFGFGSEQAIMALPWHSTDATNWEIGPCKFGQWAAYGGERVSIRGSHQNLRVEVEHYLRIERRARARWGPILEKAGLGGDVSVRLSSSSTNKVRLSKLNAARVEA